MFKEALDGNAPYDIVLMDMQMPEIDGIDEHREQCLAAGMNDFVTKPIKKEIVSGMIQKWVAYRLGFFTRISLGMVKVIKSALPE